MKDSKPQPGAGRPDQRRRPQAQRPGWLLLAGLVLVGCSSAPLPPQQWARLPAQAQAAPTPHADPAALAGTWQLLGAITLPGHLDQAAVLLPAPGSTRTQLVAHPQLRWAEPLRDAVPRLLRQDLQQALGRPLWTAPLPPGLQATRLLRLELLALDVQAGAEPGVAVRASWSLAGPDIAPQRGEIAFVQPRAGGPADASAPEPLLLAHREALAQLAQRLAAALALVSAAPAR